MVNNNKSLIFKKVPESTPVEGEHLAIENRPLDLDEDAPKNGLLLQNIYFSYDPYLRGRMRDASKKSYSEAWIIDEPVRNSTISKVLKSNNDEFHKDDLVMVYMEGYCQEYTVLKPDQIDDGIWKLENPYDLHPIYFMGPLGMPGLTAFSFFYEGGEPKKGETIFISAASGAVGSMVGQLAKREGLTVIGSVGDQKKLDYIKNDLGFDEGFNYKEEDPTTALKRLAPKGIDLYFENVGGPSLEAALESLKNYGRIIVSGMIADYNKPFEKKYGVKGLQVFFEKRLKMQGFIVADLQDKYYDQHQKKCQQWIKDGTLKVKMSTTEGIDNAVGGLLGLFNGENFGKAVLKIHKY